MIKKTFKNKKFWKIFLIPYGIWFLITLIAMIPDPTETDPLTWSDFIVVNLAILIFWFLVSFIIYCIVAFISNKIIKRKKSTILQNENMETEEKVNVETKAEIKEVKNKNTKKLYSCESVINATEYGKMAQYFPKIYWNYVLYGTIVNIIFTLIISIQNESFVVTLIFFIACQLFVLIFYKLNITKLAEKTFIKKIKPGTYDTEFLTEFYEDFFIRKGKTISIKFDYNEINSYIETKTNIYLSIENKNLIIILQKDKCSESLIEFLNKKITKEKISIDKNNNIKILKKSIKNDRRIFMIILFVITILCLWCALGVFQLVSTIKNTLDINPFKYTWTFWLWLPIPILSIILGFIYKNKGLKCTKNIVAGFIIGFFLLIYGFFGFIFKDLTNFTNSIFVITQDKFNNEINYYEVNDKKSIRSIDKFESNVNEIYTIDNCYDYLNENKLIFEKCNIKDKNQKDIEINELFKNILSDIDKNEDSMIFEVKVLGIKEKYFVVTKLNANLWTPNVLYEYKINDKKLEHIYTFSDEDVIGIKLKNN